MLCCTMTELKLRQIVYGRRSLDEFGVRRNRFRLQFALERRALVLRVFLAFDVALHGKVYHKMLSSRISKHKHESLHGRQMQKFDENFLINRPAIPAWEDSDRPPSATWWHRQLESRAACGNALAKIFRNIWAARMSMPAKENKNIKMEFVLRFGEWFMG